MPRTLANWHNDPEFGNGVFAATNHWPGLWIQPKQPTHEERSERRACLMLATLLQVDRLTNPKSLPGLQAGNHQGGAIGVYH